MSAMTSIAYEHSSAVKGIQRSWLVFLLALAATAVAIGGLFAAHSVVAGGGSAAPAQAPESVAAQNGRAEAVSCVTGQVAYVDRADTASGCDVTVQHVAAGEYR
jgi:hypothetical protein